MYFEDIRIYNAAVWKHYKTSNLAYYLLYSENVLFVHLGPI